MEEAENEVKRTLAKPINNKDVNVIRENGTIQNTNEN